MQMNVCKSVASGDAMQFAEQVPTIFPVGKIKFCQKFSARVLVMKVLKATKQF
jgi:hypothetical protein